MIASVEAEADQLMGGRLVDLDAYSNDRLDERGDGDMMDVSSHLRSVAVRAARIQEYLFVRSSGCSHEQAVKHSNATAAKVRKALGYTVVRDDINF